MIMSCTKPLAMQVCDRSYTKKNSSNMEAICKEMGLTMSAAFTIFAKKVSRERRIPFELNADPFYSEENILRLK